MEKKERFVIEILLGVTLVVFLILLTFMVTAISKPTGTQETPVVANSYDTSTNTQRVSPYSSNTLSPRGVKYDTRQPSYRDPYGSPYRSSYSKPYIVDSYPYVRNRYVQDLRYAKTSDGYLRYDDLGRRRRVQGLFGNEIDRYEVYVRNRDYRGGYFKVNFYFDDYYGRRSSDSITRYIGSQKESRFVFRDMSREKYKYGDWSYEVISQTKAPTKVYYN